MSPAVDAMISVASLAAHAGHLEQDLAASRERERILEAANLQLQRQLEEARREAESQRAPQ